LGALDLQNTLSQSLQVDINTAGLQIAEPIQQQLLKYLALIQKWNKVHNLTAVRELPDMLTLHLLDSLVVLPYLSEPYLTVNSLLDVGSGAGLPGIPIALCMPQIQVTVMDSNQKKASFMRQVKAELGIHNLTVQCGRVEAYKPAQKFDAIISRAFSDLSLFVNLTKHLASPQSKWLAMKGVFPEQEIQNLQADSQVTVEKSYVLQVPRLDAQRHLLFLAN
jgi:16S rRNA (guanine527-N7)-methyltransferase